MKYFYIIQILIFSQFQILAQEYSANPSGDSFYSSISAKEASDGNVYFSLNRSTGDDEALLRFNLGDVGDSFGSVSNTWEVGLNDNDDFSIFRHRVPFIGSPGVYNAIVISDDADGNGTKNDPEVNIPSSTKLSFGEAVGLSQPASFRSNPALGASIEMSAFFFQPSLDGLGSLGTSSRRFSALWAVDGTINTSDGRLKKNVKTIRYGLSDLMRLKPVAYNWKDNRNTDAQIGLIAQEVLKVVPEAVVTTELSVNEEGEQIVVPVENMGIKYAALIPVLISSIQEQQAMIELLKNKILEIESK